jgi:hypothetical protein
MIKVGTKVRHINPDIDKEVMKVIEVKDQYAICGHDNLTNRYFYLLKDLELVDLFTDN